MKAKFSRREDIERVPGAKDGHAANLRAMQSAEIPLVSRHEDVRSAGDRSGEHRGIVVIRDEWRKLLHEAVGGRVRKGAAHGQAVS